jgi:hypothetical protein
MSKSVSTKSLDKDFARMTPTVLLPAPGIPIKTMFCMIFNCPDFAPRGTCTLVNLVFGTEGLTVTPSKDDEYSTLLASKLNAWTSISLGD